MRTDALVALESYQDVLFFLGKLVRWACLVTRLESTDCFSLSLAHIRAV